MYEMRDDGDGRIIKPKNQCDPLNVAPLTTQKVWDLSEVFHLTKVFFLCQWPLAEDLVSRVAKGRFEVVPFLTIKRRKRRSFSARSTEHILNRNEISLFFLSDQNKIKSI